MGHSEKIRLTKNSLLVNLLLHHRGIQFRSNVCLLPAVTLRDFSVIVVTEVVNNNIEFWKVNNKFTPFVQENIQ